MLAQAGDGIGIHIQRQRHAGASGQSLQIERAATGESIQNTCAADIGRQPVEQGFAHPVWCRAQALGVGEAKAPAAPVTTDRKSTRLNSSHVKISYAVFCL